MVVVVIWLLLVVVVVEVVLGMMDAGFERNIALIGCNNNKQ